MNYSKIIMNYSKINAFLSNRFQRQARVSPSFYTRVTTWYEWYKGYVEKFHKYRINNGRGVYAVDMYRLNMGQQVAKDWSSILINEGFDINVTTNNASTSEKTSVFVKGKLGNSGVLGSQDFLSNLTMLVEKTFALGTGAIVVNLDNVQVNEAGGLQNCDNSRINLSFINALDIIPLASINGMITEACFASEVKIGKETFVILQTHVIEDGQYVIYNSIVNNCGAEVHIANYNLVPKIVTGSTTPWFFIIKPALVDTEDLNNPMGISVFSNAIDNLKGVDEAYNSLQVEVKSGSRLMLMDVSLFKTDDDGNITVPQDEHQSYIKTIGDGTKSQGSKTTDLVKEITPNLRTDAFIKNLQENLNILGMKCGLGVRYYKFDADSGQITATQYVGSKEDLYSNRGKHANMLTGQLNGLVKCIAWIGANILHNKGVSDSVSVKTTLFDSVREDDGTLRERDRQDVKDGIMNKWEYRVKWYGEDEETAKKAVHYSEPVPPATTV